MFLCTSKKAVKSQAPEAPPKPPKPSSMRLSPEAAQAALQQQQSQLVASDPPIAPPKPKSLQGKDTVAPVKKEKTEYVKEKTEYRVVDGEIHPTAGGQSKGPSCITVPCAREEVSKDGSEKYYVYMVSVKLAGKTHSSKHRFSEFASFHKEWQREYPGVSIEMPPKKIGVTDEDIARRCIELQAYLREMCDVSALIYPVAKFLGVEETELKAAIKGKSNASASDSPSTRSSNGSVSAKLPKVSLAAATAAQQKQYDDQDRQSIEKPKLPKVKLDTDGVASTPPRTETPPAKAKTAPAIEPVRKNEPVPPPPPASQKVEPPPPPPSRPQPSSSGNVATTPTKTTPPTPTTSSTPTKTIPAPTSTNVAKATDNKAAAPTAISGGTGGERVMSVKERMAAFQKNGK